MWELFLLHIVCFLLFFFILTKLTSFFKKIIIASYLFYFIHEIRRDGDLIYIVQRVAEIHHIFQPVTFVEKIKLGQGKW